MVSVSAASVAPASSLGTILNAADSATPRNPLRSRVSVSGMPGIDGKENASARVATPSGVNDIRRRGFCLTLVMGSTSEAYLTTARRPTSRDECAAPAHAWESNHLPHGRQIRGNVAAPVIVTSALLLTNGECPTTTTDRLPVRT